MIGQQLHEKAEAILKSQGWEFYDFGQYFPQKGDEPSPFGLSLGFRDSVLLIEIVPWEFGGVEPGENFVETGSLDVFESILCWVNQINSKSTQKETPDTRDRG